MASPLCRILFLALALVAVPVLRAQREKLPDADLAFVEKNWPDAKKTSTGIRYVIQEEGTGEAVNAGDVVNLIYAGRLIDGTVIDQVTNRERPFSFRVGRGLVIDGWDQIMQTMKKGERALVIIPPELAYGMRGSPPRVPRNATLIFLIELLDIKRAAPL